MQCTLSKLDAKKNDTQIQLVNRKQFIEYKLKLANRVEGGASTLQPAEKASLIQELTEVKSSLDKLLRQYEKDFGEHFNGTGASIVAPNSAIPQQLQQSGSPTAPTSPLVQSRINAFVSKSTSDIRGQRRGPT